MKVTIEAETDAERKGLAEPWVRTGMLNVVCVGQVGADAVRFHSAGDLLAMVGYVSQVMEELRMELHRKSAMAGTIDASNFMAQAQHQQAIAQEVLQGRNGNLRIHRP